MTDRRVRIDDRTSPLHGLEGIVLQHSDAVVRIQLDRQPPAPYPPIVWVRAEHAVWLRSTNVR